MVTGLNSLVQTTMETFPYVNQENDLKVIDIVGIVVFPFSLSFLVPVLMHTLVVDKEEKLRIMLEVCILEYYL